MNKLKTKNNKTNKAEAIRARILAKGQHSCTIQNLQVEDFEFPQLNITYQKRSKSFTRFFYTSILSLFYVFVPPDIIC